MSLWLPVALYMGAIFVSSSMSDPPGPPGIVPDKLTHATLYAGLALLLARALAGGLGRPLTAGAAAAAAILSTLYGVTDEIHQRVVPLRQMELLDLVADALGASVAAWALYAWSRARIRKL
jgi:VanZ family protein